MCWTLEVLINFSMLTETEPAPSLLIKMNAEDTRIPRELAPQSEAKRKQVP